MFVRPPSGWVDTQRSGEADRGGWGRGDAFGVSVGISGDVIVVGARQARVGGNASRGALYVFVKPAAGWVDMSHTAKLIASDGGMNHGLGTSVAIDGDTIVAGATGANDSAGAVYVFQKLGSGWGDAQETAKLEAAGGLSVNLGHAVDIRDDTVLATVPGFGAEAAALLFVRPANGWANSTEVAALTASDGTSGDWFGVSAALGSGGAVVGAPQAMVFDQPRGAVYVYDEPGTGWVSATESAKLAAPVERSSLRHSTPCPSA